MGHGAPLMRLRRGPGDALTARAPRSRATTGRGRPCPDRRPQASRLRMPPGGMRVRPESRRQGLAHSLLPRRLTTGQKGLRTNPFAVQEPMLRDTRARQFPRRSGGHTLASSTSGAAWGPLPQRPSRPRLARSQPASPRARDPSTRRTRDAPRAARARSTRCAPLGVCRAAPGALPLAREVHRQSAWRHRPRPDPRARLAPRCAPPCLVTWDPRRRQHDHHSPAP